MPQELRVYQYRTGEAMDEVTKTLMIAYRLNNPTFQKYQVPFEFIVESVWPGINHMEADLLLNGLDYLNAPKATEVN